MLSVATAQQMVLDRARPLPVVTAPLSPDKLGWVLAVDVASDLDMPPFDKSLVDGYAVRVEDVQAQAALQVIEEVPAGQVPVRTVGAGQATRIMTGAPIPAGATAVVMVERTRLEGKQVVVEDSSLRNGQHILPRAKEMRRGEVVLTAGTVLRPQEFGVLGTVGHASAKLIPAPRVAVLPTGDEIVEAWEKPGPGQIRNGNGPMLLAQVQRAGGLPRFVGIARDRVDSLRPMVEDGLQADILVISGGVSAGKLDLVPGVLAELGVEAIFHQVAMKPGKPIFFGVKQKDDGRTLVFGLPGNPVSSLVCFELFVRPAIRALKGLPPGPQLVQAALSADHAYKTDRPTYHPAQLEATSQGWRVSVQPWFGSPDLRGVLGANAFVLFPPGDHVHRAGGVFSVLQVE